MTRVATVVIGAGQAGLAVSRCLSARGVEHVVLERGEVGHRWRTQSWDSLRLLTPNWMTRLPGLNDSGLDPEGFMAVPELVALLERYAASSHAPVETRTTVRAVRRSGHRFRIDTDRGTWLADAVVVATGHCGVPLVPVVSRAVPTSVEQLVPADYRRPDQLRPGGVLIVGASATGVQLAEEIQRTGRQVTLAVGRHTRLPRRYRGQDILWWLDRMGVLSQPASTVANLEASRRQPSLQLVGRADGTSIDLATLRRVGVRLAGRLVGIQGSRIEFADDLVTTAAAADLKMADVLTRIDRHIASHRMHARPRESFQPTWPLAADAPRSVDFVTDRIDTVIWATGYRRAYPWLRIPVLDSRGDILHDRGMTAVPGLYALGLHFQTRRNSSFIDGVGADAIEIAQHITSRLAN
ncbi:MAG: flavin-containing monooxygenase, partial [Vicinamibacterales bacterium]